MKRNNKRFNLALLPVLFIIAILPLITFIYFFPEGVYEGYSWFADRQAASDQFTHAKAIVFSIIAVILFFESAGAFLKLDSIGKKNCLKKIWPFIVYAVMIILSTIFSLDRQYSIHGAFDQMEPFLVLLGYSMVVPYIIMKFENHEDMKYINYAIVFGTTIISFIGLLQMLGIDIFTLPFMRYLIMTSKMRETVPELSSSGAVYITFGNQNYVGSYVCLMLPMVVSVILYKGPKWLRILAVIDAVGLVTILVGSHSKTGMAILAIVVAVGLIFIGKRVIKKWYIYVPIVIIGIAVFIILNIKRNVYFFDALKDFVVSEKKEYELTGIDTKGDCIKLNYKGDEICFYISYGNDKMKVEVKDNGKKCPIRQNIEDYSNVVTLTSGEELNFQVLFYDEDDIRLELKLIGTVFAFSFDSTTDDYKIQNAFGVLDESTVLENVLPGREWLASGRGYIWGITVPKLKNYLFLGSGPDTFPVAIGKDGTDYALKQNYKGFATTFIRPHNYFLQMGINTGVLSLAVCLVYFATYIVECFKLYFWKELNTEQKKMGFCCMLAVIGFLGCGFANDSMVTVSPLFWTMLGIGTLLNKWQMEEKKNVRSIKA